MSIKNNLLLEIYNFVSNAYLTTEAFKEQFSLKASPIKVVQGTKSILPKEGCITVKNQKVYYKFHGYGCKFIFPKERIIDLDYQMPEGKYDGRFGFYNILEYTLPVIPEFTDESLLENMLGKLEKENLIIPIPKPNGFKEKIAGSIENMHKLEKDGFFSKFDRPKYKGYKLGIKNNNKSVPPQE